MSEARTLALEIARCPELAACAVQPDHPCRRVVQVQGAAADPYRQVPEAWAGALETARLLYLSSNPSLSEPGDANSGDSAELFPLAEWSDEDIVDFITRRFDVSREQPRVVQDRFRRLDGTLSTRRVPYWREARRRATELLGYPADPAVDYALTEVVRCKSKKEVGVGEAVSRCAPRYLQRTVELCPAPVLVVVGAKARDKVVPLLDLPADFGQRRSSPRENVAVRSLGGAERAMVYLPHLTGMESGGRSFTHRFGQAALEQLRQVALGTLPPRAIAT